MSPYLKVDHWGLGINLLHERVEFNGVGILYKTLRQCEESLDT